MKKQKTLKAFVLSVAMAIAMSLPMTVNAQDFFIRGGEDNHENRDGEGGAGLALGGMTPQGTNEPAPLGSGLLIMMAAGAGYAILKKKEA